MLLQHDVKLGVEVGDLLVDFPGKELNFLIVFQLLQLLHHLGGGLTLSVTSHLRLGLFASKDALVWWCLTLGLQGELEVFDLGLRVHP